MPLVLTCALAAAATTRFAVRRAAGIFAALLRRVAARRAAVARLWACTSLWHTLPFDDADGAGNWSSWEAARIR